MSDDEKTALLKALQANLQEKGCWTAEWLSASGVPCPPVREEELARLKEAKEELAETVRASETKKEELAALRIELDEMTKRRGAILVAVREEEQKLADLHKGDDSGPGHGGLEKRNTRGDEFSVGEIVGQD